MLSGQQPLPQPPNQSRPLIPNQHVSTLMTPPPGYIIVETLGVVRGVSILNKLAVMNSLNDKSWKLKPEEVRNLYKNQITNTRSEAYHYMVSEAYSIGANGVLGMTHTACDIAGCYTEVLCYGTAVRLAPAV